MDEDSPLCEGAGEDKKLKEKMRKERVDEVEKQPKDRASESQRNKGDSTKGDGGKGQNTGRQTTGQEVGRASDPLSEVGPGTELTQAERLANDIVALSVGTSVGVGVGVGAGVGIPLALCESATGWQNIEFSTPRRLT